MVEDSRNAEGDTMREIKFRAWAYASKVIFYPDSDEGWELKNGVITPLFNTMLMQFTGLHDKNGKEIYEGDLIRTYINLIFVVKFTMGAFWIEWISKSESEDMALQLLSAKNKSSVVIGNIYENPELLEDKW